MGWVVIGQQISVQQKVIYSGTKNKSDFYIRIYSHFRNARTVVKREKDIYLDTYVFIVFQSDCD